MSSASGPRSLIKVIAISDEQVCSYAVNSSFPTYSAGLHVFDPYRREVQYRTQDGDQHSMKLRHVRD
jgi:hypothetical protein